MTSSLRFHPPFIAHRGVSALAPENTMAAFRLVPQSGTKWFEFDVHLTSDGVPVVIHDDRLERTTDGKGKVADMMWADMQKLDAGSWFDKKFKGERVPHLAEVLHFALTCDLRPVIEIKPCPGRAQATTMVTLIEAAKIWPHEHTSPLIVSFDPEVLGIASRLQPHWPRGLSFEKWHEDWRQRAAKVHAAVVSMDTGILTRERMQSMVRYGMALLVYTVNDPARARELLSQGARGIFSDNPQALVKAL